MKYRIKKRGNRWVVQSLVLWFIWTDVSIDPYIGNNFRFKEAAEELKAYLENLGS